MKHVNAKKKAPAIRSVKTDRPIKVDLRLALDMLPRYNSHRNSAWPVDGNKVVTNAQVIPDNALKTLKAVMKTVDSLGYRPRRERVDVSGGNVWVLHRHLWVKSLMYLYRKSFKWQQWKDSKLPVYLRWKGYIVIWNGTHRMSLCKMTRRKVCAMVFDLDKFAAWRKANPAQNYRVIKVKGKRNGNCK